MMPALKKLEETLYIVEQVVLVLFLAVLVGMAGFQASLSILFKLGFQWAGDLFSSTHWIQSFLRHLALITAFLGASLATRQGRHLSIDALSRVLPPRGRVGLRSALSLLSAVICVFMAQATWGLIQIDPSDAFSLGSFSMSTAAYLTIVLGSFGLIAFRFVIRAFQDAYQVWTGQIEEEALPI